MLECRRLGLKTLEGVIACWEKHLSWARDEEPGDREEFWREGTMIMIATLKQLREALRLQAENARLRERVKELEAKQAAVGPMTDGEIAEILTRRLLCMNEDGTTEEVDTYSLRKAINLGLWPPEVGTDG